MPRLDARIKTKLPINLLNNNHNGDVINNNIVATEISLSGALIVGLDHEVEDVLSIKPKLVSFNGNYLIGEVVRKFENRAALKFYFSDDETKSILWKYIKNKLPNINVCPYCNSTIKTGAEYCKKCNWLLNFKDRKYLDKHDRETFVANLRNSTKIFDLDQMQRVRNFVDAELLKGRDGFLHSEFAGKAKNVHDVFGRKETSTGTSINTTHILKEKKSDMFSFDSIVSRHPAMVQIVKLIKQVADTNANIIIQGESGTGKELIAQALHSNSRRKDYPFVPINCSAIPDNLMESMLFGHVRGAFTDAVRNKTGLFESADNGTIFLDEVSEMAPSMQVKLLRILQTGEFSRLGSTEISYCNARILAATNNDLRELVQKGEFREDLYYRLNVLDIVLPPLRERMSDVPVLIQHFLKAFNSKKNLRLSQDAESLLMSYYFPGNVRELENIIQRAVVLVNGDTIEVQHLPDNLNGNKSTSGNKIMASSFKAAKKHLIEQFELKFFKDCLQSSKGNISRAAGIAGINSKNFHAKINKYNINPQIYKPMNRKSEV